MTGRAAGFCAGAGAPGYARPAFGRGFGRGRGGWYQGGWFGGCGFRGGGRGWRNMFFETGLPGWARGGWSGEGAADPAFGPLPEAAAQMEALQSRAAALQSALDSVQRRLQELASARTSDDEGATR